MNIWHLESVSNSLLMLWRVEPDKFRVVQYDNESAPLLTNSDYILMDKKFKPIIDKLVGQVEIQNVTIYDQVRNLQWDNYFEIKIFNTLNPDFNVQLDPTGQKIWAFEHGKVFLSEELKTHFEKYWKGEFEFSRGFSRFAGSSSL